MLIKKVSNYSCRFIDSRQKVYAVMHKREPYITSSIYTVPFHNKHTPCTSNAILCFKDEYIASLCTIPDATDAIITILSIDDALEFGHIMHLPVIVLVDMYCDLSEQNHDVMYEIGYFDPRPSNVNNSL